MSGVALALPATAILGALGLCGVMVGAVLTHLRTPGEAPMALVPLFLLGAVAAASYRPGAARAAVDPPMSNAARGLALFVAAVTVITPFLADLNETHLFNPLWSGHARFHSAHTMLLGAAMGALSVWMLLGKRQLLPALVLLGAFWATQALAITFPGTTFVDPEHAMRIPHVRGFPLNQLMIDAVLLGLLGLAGSVRRWRPT